MSYLLLFCSCVFSPFCIAITSLREERANFSAIICSCLVLSSSSSSCLGRAMICDCGTTWTFLLSFFCPVSCIIGFSGPHLALWSPCRGRGSWTLCFSSVCGLYTVSSRKHTYIILTPLKPHYYIVKLGFTGVYIMFLIAAQNIDCWYSLEPPRRGGSNEYPQSMFLSRNVKNIRIFYL